MDWQQIAIALIVLGAALYLAKHYFGGKKGACGGCEACPGAGQSPSAKDPPAPGLVQLEVTPRRRPTLP